MKHVNDMKTFMKLLMDSEQFHALLVQSPPGWAKSTTINKILADLGADWVSVGSYSTPLNFYNSVCEAPDKIIVLDDCAGLFDNIIAMSLLKAATWPVQGTGDRILKWGSTSDKVLKPSVRFTGKLILLTNILPKGRDTEAFLSRTISYHINFTKSTIADMLGEAARQKKYYPNTKRAKQVAEYLSKAMGKRDYTRMNLRTLQMGYELASTEPKVWKDAFEKLLPRVEPKELVRQLSTTDDSVEDQARHFMNSTALSRMSFFRYRQELGIEYKGKPGPKKKDKALRVGAR